VLLYTLFSLFLKFWFSYYISRFQLNELEMNRLKEKENGDRKAKALALKSVALAETSEVRSSEDSET